MKGSVSTASSTRSFSVPCDGYPAAVSRLRDLRIDRSRAFPRAVCVCRGDGLRRLLCSLFARHWWESKRLDGLLSIGFLVVTFLGWARIMWVAALFIFALVSRWTGKKSFWVASSPILVLALTVPLVGERILPGGPGDITDTETIDRITSGRYVLWEELWRRGAEALPWGNGWGYTWSLTPIDLFGFEGAFRAGGNPFVYPHNDFLFVFLELGILGLGLLIGFRVQLLRRIRLVSRAHDEAARFGVRVLVPVLVVGLLVQLFDNGFAIRPVAERFFIAAGLVLGLIFSWQRSAAESVLISPLGGPELA